MMVVSTYAYIRGKIYILEYLRTYGGVLLYQSELLFGEPSALIDYSVGNTYLSNIMEQSHKVYVPAVTLALAVDLGDLLGVFCHTS